ncbi:uncharacterized protein Z520_02744 [Fonsecaea multimorphosa CBS 102226]|uniref:Enoyl-CoA hydratase n=1 Tax=Fonsecaea multimorphosa CBS 102226 TaxID=1442371 RepID=A0A0D2IVV8_9EURO|nr:uncharacterized protein Z520_02744 [Fonsecaea multimorphosa CBS 102226]KIY01192.1 hypothetical protein Z520_02744 [Fonsecaea multimorphosa CBS 102226]OAL28804.1 hypothetical protein AYO22_02669 [Fonsecaea multimorphosa]
MPGSTDGEVLPVAISFSQRSNGTIATVTVSNPKKLNSLNTTVLDAFLSSVPPLAQRSDLRCVIVTGGPCSVGQQAFIGGADISEMKDFPNAEAGRTFINKLHLACKALRDLPMPVVARVNGHALGGGMVVMASADLRIATSDARFGMPEVQRGVPSTIEAAMLPAQIGAARARRLLFLGDTISAQEAESWGLVNRVVPADQLDRAVEEWVGRLLMNGPRALRTQKKLFTMWEQVPLREAIEAGVWEFGPPFEAEGFEAEGRRMMNEFQTQNRRRKGKL